MNKKEISALLASELVNRSATLKEIGFNPEIETTVNEVLAKPTSSFSKKEFVDSVHTLSQKTAPDEFCARALEYFQDQLAFADIVNFYSGETTQLIVFADSVSIKDFFCKMSGCREIDLAKLISAPVILRPMLIDLVEATEFLTGKNLKSRSRQPLAYLEKEVTYADIAEYFSNGNEKVNHLYGKVVKAQPPTFEQVLARFRALATVVYAQQIGKSSADKDFTHLKVKEQLPVNFSSGTWDLAIAWTEDELGVQVTDKLADRINDESIVIDLLDLFCEVFEQKIK